MKVFRQSYTVKGEQRHSKKWYGRVKEGGKWKNVPLHESRKIAQEMLDDLRQKARRGELGIELPTAPMAGVIEDAIDQWTATLDAKGNHAGTVDTISVRTKTLLAKIGARQLADLEHPQAGNRVELALADMRKEGLAARTSNHYLRHVKQFVKWLAEGAMIRGSRISSVKPVRVEGALEHERRPFTPEELTFLLGHVEKSEPRGRRVKVSGPDRAMAYGLSAATGLRLGELLSLEPESFDFTAATVTVEAAYSKRRRRDVLPIPGPMLPRIQKWVKGRPAGEPLWHCPWFGKTFERDLADARKAARRKHPFLAREANGRFLDFHSLRHTFITTLARKGVHPKKAQMLARHSTITLTMAFYTHFDLEETRAQADEASIEW